MKRTLSSETSRRKKTIGIVIGAVIIAGLVGGFFIYKKVAQKDKNKTIYQYETVKRGSLTNIVPATGNVAVRDEVNVNASVTGTIKKINVSVGDKVAKGDILFTLSSDDIESQIKQAYSSVLSARQQVAQAQSSLNSAKAQLASAQSASKSAADQTQVSTTSKAAAQKSVEAAQLGVAAANAQLSNAQSDYDSALDARNDLKVKAPCKGTIWSINVDKGDEVSASGATSSSSSSGTSSSAQGGSGATSTSDSSSSSASSSALVSIAKNSKLGVQVSVNESDINSIKKGQSVSVSLDAVTGKTYRGKIDEISDEGTVSSNVVSYSVWVILDKTTLAVKSGMTASVDIETSKEEDVMLVSNAAVKGSGSNKYVLIMQSGATTPTQQKVTTGTRGSSQTVIKSGLVAGQKIVAQAITLDSSGNTTSVLGSMMGGSKGQRGDMPNGGGAVAGESARTLNLNDVSTLFMGAPSDSKRYLN